MVKMLFKTVSQFLKNVNTKLLCDPNIPLLGIYLNELKIGPRVICAPMFIAALFMIAKRQRSQMPADR